MTTRVAVIQSAPVFGEPEANCAALVRQITSVDADVYVLPELALSGYLFVSHAEVRASAETVADACLMRLREVARARDAAIIVGFAEAAGDRVYNSAAVLAPEGVLGVYRKIHLFADERRWFAPGDTPPLVVHWRGRALGVMICFDWFFPETARCLALAGAELLCHPANLVMPFCQDAMRTRSLENRVFSATANRVGREERGGESLTFTGRSQITGIGAQRVVAGPETGEWVAVAEIDLAAARDKRLSSGNDLFADRRPALYPGLGARNV